MQNITESIIVDGHGRPKVFRTYLGDPKSPNHKTSIASIKINSILNMIVVIELFIHKEIVDRKQLSLCASGDFYTNLINLIKPIDGITINTDTDKLLEIDYGKNIHCRVRITDSAIGGESTNGQGQKESKRKI